MTTPPTPFCCFCGDDLSSITSHNATSCWAKRTPEPPHHLQAILPTKRLPRWWILADRANRDELRGHHG